MTSRQRIEFGDFQTPPELARQVCRVLHRAGVRPRSILEPTCGTGTLLAEALDRFPDTRQAMGVDVEPTYVRAARRQCAALSTAARVEIDQGDFFHIDWRTAVAQLQEPVLVVGNPPWVTNAGLSRIRGSNCPQKTNTAGLRGIEALTGRSNFDVSEWILRELLEALDGRIATLAMLCKTQVARKTLVHAWRQPLQLGQATIHRIDAAQSFGASVDACLFVGRLRPGDISRQCAVYPRIGARQASHTLAFSDDRLISNRPIYERWRCDQGISPRRWRSGIKHDCAQVMELRSGGGSLRNGLNEPVELEEAFLYPMLKSSQLARGNLRPDRWMLVPQRSVGEETAGIRTRAPRTWQYLLDHAERLDGRASSIYRRRPRFSIFGVGKYSFAPWKVAISGFYKQLQFRKLGTYGGRPIMLDDTCYFLACDQEQEADELLQLLNHSLAREFFSSLIYWEAKRPITIEVLSRLDLDKLRQHVGRK